MDGVAFAMVLLLLGVLVISQIGLWIVLVQIVQQQGRILLRLDHLQLQPEMAAPDLLPIVQPAATQPGLPVGSEIGDFQLADLSGDIIRPSTWRGERVFLIHWNTTCGFCELIAPELARLEATLLDQKVRLVLASYGDASANRLLAEEYGLGCSILLQPEAQPIAGFTHLGTPVAYLLDENGRVAEPLISGADAVLEAARRLAVAADSERRRLSGERSLSQSRIERNGLKAGSIAPGFNLPDLYGHTVTLESYRGHHVLLVFTDPHCGPCDALAPTLARLAREGHKRGLQVVMIARGAQEENRSKAEQFGFSFAVALQKHWEISRAYGIFATPVGFLIDEQGVIVRDVAMGADAIVALADESFMPATAKELANGRAVR